MNRKRASSAVVLFFVLVVVGMWALPVAAQGAADFVICKETIPGGLDQSFQFEWGELVFDGQGQNAQFTLKDGECENFELDIGQTYSFLEEVPEGWEARFECDFPIPLQPDPDEVPNDIVGVAVILRGDEDVGCTFTNVAPPPATAPPPPPPPPFVPEASTFMLLGGAATTLAGYVGLQIRARRRK